MPVYDLGSSNSGLINDTAKGFFLRLGGWGNMAGPGLFMFRVMLSGTTSSAVLGLAGASIGALMWGTASLPFVVSSCIGFVFGATGFYFDAVQRSRIMLERYPRLLQLHLDANFPRRDFLSWRIDQLRGSTFSRSWLLQSMLICSWLTALPAIEVRMHLSIQTQPHSNKQLGDLGQERAVPNSAGIVRHRCRIQRTQERTSQHGPREPCTLLLISDGFGEN